MWLLIMLYVVHIRFSIDPRYWIGKAFYPAIGLANCEDLRTDLRLSSIVIHGNTGTHCGHTVVAMWHEDELYILESQVKGNYWPKDFIQVRAFQ